MPSFSGGAPIWARFVTSSKQTGQRESAEAECQLPQEWERRSYTALDVETTGLDAYNDRVLEIGIVQFSYDGDGALVEERSWQSLVNPGIAIPASATAIHGITDFDVFASPFFREVAAQLAGLLEGRVMVAHNAPFDAGFIAREFARLGMASPVGETADSLILLRRSVPNLLSYSLGKAAFTLGVDTGSSHRALDDARTCMHLFTLSARKLAGACP